MELCNPAEKRWCLAALERDYGAFPSGRKECGVLQSWKSERPYNPGERKWESYWTDTRLVLKILEKVVFRLYSFGDRRRDFEGL
jgi:hypothetical protein